MTFRKPNTKDTTGALFVLLFGAVTVLGLLSFSQAKDISDLKAQAVNKEDLAANMRLLRGDIDANRSLLRPVIDATASVAYLPEFRIKIPFNDIAKTLAYSMRSTDSSVPEGDATSTSYIAPEQQTVMNCSNLVRLKIESKPNPYSPHEKVTSVNLGDGRTLQVYEASGIGECETSWNNPVSMSPATVAAAFKNATAY